MPLDEIQSLMDAGMTVSQIARHYGTHHNKISRLIERHNLEWYVAFDEAPINSKEYWYYDDRFKLYKANYGYENKKDCIVDAIGEFLCQYDPDEITIHLLEEFRHIRHYAYEVFGTLPKMYEYYGIDKSSVEYSMNKKARACANWGHKFDSLVKEVFDELSYDYECHKKFGDSIPDYVVGDCWYDAKLSRSTSFSWSCTTLDKYAKHTDHLTIIYALHDTEADDDRATFVSITEYKPFVSAELQRKIDDFIRKASEVKFGASNRLSDGQVRYGATIVSGG